MVCSLRHEYGGTADAFVEIDGKTWLIEYKTGSGVYPDTALQLAGLARAQFIGRPGDSTQYPIPAATRFGVLPIRPEGARLLPVVVDRSTVAAFLDARRLRALAQLATAARGDLPAESSWSVRGEPCDLDPQDSRCFILPVSPSREESRANLH